jgi:ATP-binding cassette subfamily F protein uup
MREVGSGRKLSYILQRELDKLPQVIDSVEKKIEILRAETLEANFYEQAYANTQPILDQLIDLETELERHIARWTELEGMVEQMRDPRS